MKFMSYQADGGEDIPLMSPFHANDDGFTCIGTKDAKRAFFLKIKRAGVASRQKKTKNTIPYFWADHR